MAAIPPGVFLFFSLSFYHVLSAPKPSIFLVTTVTVEPLEVREYLEHFSNLRVNTPLKRYLGSPEELYVLCKAAEFAARTFKGLGNRNSFRLRNILDLKNEVGALGYQFRLLLIDKNTGKLQVEVFDVAVSELRNGNYRVEVGDLRPKRSDVSSRSKHNETCDFLSKLANCSECGYKGICHKGTTHISPWLTFALKTQRELQSNVSFSRFQMLGAHNAFNDRADGYGEMDDCRWPPPYEGECIDLANQEFSFTDLLDMGVRALEIDPWWCFGKMRMSHAYHHAYLGCSPWDREFHDGIREIAEWVKKPVNSQDIVRVYLEDGASHTAGHDDLINGPIQKYFGDKVLTPNDTGYLFKDRWPTVSEMRKIGKTVLFASGNSYNHKGAYVHKGYWTELTVNQFFSYPNCTAVKNELTPLRVYSDSTEYGPFWNGPKRTGTILSYMDYLKCNVIYPAADQVNPQLLETSLFTWAIGEPKNTLTDESCVLLCWEDQRWHVENCVEKHPFACVSAHDENDWVVSSGVGQYFEPLCPNGYSFSVPHDAKHHSRLLHIVDKTDVWINLTPFISLVNGLAQTDEVFYSSYAFKDTKIVPFILRDCVSLANTLFSLTARNPPRDMKWTVLQSSGMQCAV